MKKNQTPVIYQIYPRSFRDSNGDGVGDLKGIIQSLPYLASLGVDYLWISPFLKSPQRDFGYDISDYFNVDPLFGNNADLEELVAAAGRHGLKIMMDMVIAHTSNEHAWFQESRASADNAKQDWYVWADAKPDGSPPNNWLSVFGGPAWIWESRRSQYYLTHFLKEQPALNLYNPQVEEKAFEIFRHWLDKGVKGFRFDVIHFAHYDRKLRNNPAKIHKGPVTDQDRHPFGRQQHKYDWAQPATHGLLEKIRKVCDSHGDILLLGEISGSPSLKVARNYTRSNRLHLGYTYDLIAFPEKLDPKGMSRVINDVISHMPKGGYSWAGSNHDSKRFVTRIEPDRPDLHPAVAACYLALLLSLPGSVCIYQGDELGLPQADVAFEDLQDPYDKEFYPYHVGRDGARTPFPWDATQHHAGFSAAQKTWLPVSLSHVALSSFQQQNDPASTLNEVRRLLDLRKKTPALLQGRFDWVHTGSYLAFSRTRKNEKIYALFNLSARNVLLTDIPPGKKLDLGGFQSTSEGIVMPPYSYGFWVEKQKTAPPKKSPGTAAL